MVPIRFCFEALPWRPVLFEVFIGRLRERFPLIFPSQRFQKRYYFSYFIAGKGFAHLNFAHYQDCISEAID